MKAKQSILVLLTMLCAVLIYADEQASKKKQVTEPRKHQTAAKFGLGMFWTPVIVQYNRCGYNGTLTANGYTGFPDYSVRWQIGMGLMMPGNFYLGIWGGFPYHELSADNRTIKTLALKYDTEFSLDLGVVPVRTRDIVFFPAATLIWGRSNLLLLPTAEQDSVFETLLADPRREIHIVRDTVAAGVVFNLAFPRILLHLRVGYNYSPNWKSNWTAESPFNVMKTRILDGPQTENHNIYGGIGFMISDLTGPPTRTIPPDTQKVPTTEKRLDSAPDSRETK